MCQHNLPCSIVYAHRLLPGRAFASLYVLLFLEKKTEIGGRAFQAKNLELFVHSTTRNVPYVHPRPDSILELCKTFPNDNF